ncbi:uncharacterized protein LOC142326039 [Lycorma delicatula]|uniref:uncharacterized protein LOC142326039 n=1 Tax=Lycorma delicatula TaxID=130591 RepID=UPI003F510704
MLKILLLLILNVNCFTAKQRSQTGNKNSPVDCSNGGFFQKPNPESCTSFYKCDNGNPVLFQCPDSLEYSPTKNVCTWKRESGCKINPGKNDNSSEPNQNQSKPRPTNDQNSLNKPNSNNSSNPSASQDGKENNDDYYPDMMFLN